LQEHAFIFETVAAVCYLIVGIRLFRLAVRTHQSAERLLGAMFLVTGTSYLIYQSPILFDREELWTALNFAGRVCYMPAPILLAIFTRKVFRPTAGWGGGLVAVTIALMIVGVGLSALGGDLEGYSIDNPWFWCEWLGYTLPFGWAGVEAILQYRLVRRQRVIGLGDALVCNRFLLWGVFGAVSVVVSCLALAQYAEYQAANQFTAFWDSLVGGGEIVSVGLIWFIFMPPPFYRRWIEAAGVDEGAATVDAPRV